MPLVFWLLEPVIQALVKFFDVRILCLCVLQSSHRRQSTCTSPQFPLSVSHHSQDNNCMMISLVLTLRLPKRNQCNLSPLCSRTQSACCLLSCFMGFPYVSRFEKRNNFAQKLIFHLSSVCTCNTCSTVFMLQYALCSKSLAAYVSEKQVCES